MTKPIKRHVVVIHGHSSASFPSSWTFVSFFVNICFLSVCERQKMLVFDSLFVCYPGSHLDTPGGIICISHNQIFIYSDEHNQNSKANPKHKRLLVPQCSCQDIAVFMVDSHRRRSMDAYVIAGCIYTDDGHNCSQHSRIRTRGSIPIDQREDSVFMIYFFFCPSYFFMGPCM